MRFFFILSVFLSTFSISFSQTHIGDIWLNSQAKVDSFGALGYTTFEGHLRIHDASITDLSALSDLTEIVGKLTVLNNDNLSSLNGLNNIVKVTDIVSINDNDALTSLEGLNNLDSIQNELKILENDNIVNLNGLNNLTSITNKLTVKNNASLLNFNGIENLSAIDQGIIIIDGNPSLIHVTSLTNQNQLNTLKLENNEALNNLDGFQNLYQLYGLYLNNNNAITSLEGFNNLSTLFNINLFNNASLTSLSGLENVSITHYIFISDNPSLADYCALNNLINADPNYLSLFSAANNLYNPTLTELENGYCADCTVANPINTTLDVIGQSVLSTQSGATYQWLNCDSNYAIIPNETTNIFTSLTYGNFAVEITYSGCVDTSACITINTVGIPDELTSTSMTLYPNPTSNILHLNLGELQTANLIVTNTLGQVVYSKNNITENKYSFELNAPNGLYYVNVFNQNVQKQFKVIKQ